MRKFVNEFALHSGAINNPDVLWFHRNARVQLHGSPAGGRANLLGGVR